MPGELRRHLPLDRLKLRTGMRAGQIEEGARDPGQAFAGLFKRGHGVFKRRRVFLIRDGVDFRTCLGHGHVEAFGKMPWLDFGERRQFEGRGPVGEKRVVWHEMSCRKKECVSSHMGADGAASKWIGFRFRGWRSRAGRWPADPHHIVFAARSGHSRS